MPRFIIALAASLAAIAACSSQPSQQTGGQAGSARPAAPARSAGSGSQAAVPAARPASVIDQVRQSAPAGAHVEAAGLAVPGLDLFSVTDPAPAREDDGVPARLVGVAGGVGGQILDGRELVRAAIAGKPDPATLARVALAVAQDDGQLLQAADTREQRKAKVGRPAIAHDALGFWVRTTDVPPQIEHGTLDLISGALTLELLPQPNNIAISNAMTTLGSVSVARHATAVRTLARLCDEPRARQALLAALANHPRARTRAAITDEVHHCGAPAVGGLISAMEQDASGLVRRHAAAALGRIGDPRARPALAKAARGDDANLAWSASNALKKIQ